MSVLVGLKRDKLRQLSAENLGGTAEVVHEDTAGLLVFGEIATLVEAAASGAVHVELGGPGELDDEAAGSLRSTLSCRLNVSLFQGNVLNPGEGVLDLVTCGVVVNVVGDTSLFGRVENDKVHGALADTTPCADGQRATVEVLDNSLAGCGVSVEHEACIAVWEALTGHAANRPGAICVHSQVLPHGIRNAVTVLAALNAALSNVLDLSTPIICISKDVIDIE